MVWSSERKWEMLIEELDNLAPGEDTLLILDAKHVVVIRIATDEDIARIKEM
jgi:hypothetical protein